MTATPTTQLTDEERCRSSVRCRPRRRFWRSAERGPRWRAAANPAVYIPNDPAVIVGVLGKDCPDGWEWRSGVTGRPWYPADDAMQFGGNGLGMIRPAPRPDVVVSIPADLADRITHATWKASELGSVADLIRAARDEAQS